ncbi:Dehydrogenase multihelical [Penicillium capsulatum]|uniref:Dehydrogenase multihelical n=1 Tax=Penicillium capsulatum TaxID=69766 RepID=A0A9W9LR41_9EURO|nr:Dehydrogenase multihelical [Penicillium capsulatum]KAJ6136290.1 Dehydrogenase multihelical [Penicillium capsulatum]
MRAVTVGIVSIGDMGLGMAKLLLSHGEHTLARIQAAAIEALPSDHELVVHADYILSIVPPRSARATAERIATTCSHPDTASRRQSVEDVNGHSDRSPLYYLELNATPPRQAEELAGLFDGTLSTGTVPCHYFDGGIIGGPPSQNVDGKWKQPSVVLSGSVELPSTWASLASVLHVKLVSPRIGAASTLKLSFAALTKGLTALSILSVSTAQQEDLLPELLGHLDEYSPQTAALARTGVVGMSPKAYRWVEEMHGIGEAFDREGGWDGVGSQIYGGMAEIYRRVAEETILGQERVGARDRGTSVEDAATIISSTTSRTMSSGHCQASHYPSS